MSFHRRQPPNKGAAANRRPAGQLDGSGNSSAIVTSCRAFPAAVAELGSLGHIKWLVFSEGVIRCDGAGDSIFAERRHWSFASHTLALS
jgi:hypothetical protein